MIVLALVACQPGYESFLDEQRAVYEATGQCPREVVGDPPPRDPEAVGLAEGGGEVEDVTGVGVLGAYVEQRPVEGGADAGGEVEVSFTVKVLLPRGGLPPRSCERFRLREIDWQARDVLLWLYDFDGGVEPASFFTSSGLAFTVPFRDGGWSSPEGYDFSYGFWCLDTFVSPDSTDAVMVPWSGSWFAHFDAVEDPQGTVRPRNWFATFEQVECASTQRDCCPGIDADLDGEEAEDRNLQHCKDFAWVCDELGE